MSAVQSQATPAEADAGAINVDDDTPFEPFEDEAQQWEVAQVRARHARSLKRLTNREWS